MNVRESFELRYSDEGRSPKPVERSSGYGYVLISAQIAWNAWQAAALYEREECAKVLDGVGARIQTDDEPDDFWRGVGTMVEVGEVAIMERSKQP